MKKRVIILVSSFIMLISAIESCKCKSNCPQISKEDSILIAKDIIKRYPQLQGPKVANFIRDRASIGKAAVKPIDFDTVKTYAANYDSNELIKDGKGFLINTQGMTYLMAHPEYKQVYLRFGKRTDDPVITDDYTVMVLPLKDNSTLVHKGVGSATTISNYDYLDPCPKCIVAGQLLGDN